MLTTNVHSVYVHVLNMYSIHTFVVILCIITHLKTFSDNGMFAKRLSFKANSRYMSRLIIAYICAVALPFGMYVFHV